MMPVISPGEGYSKSQVSVKTRSGSFTYGFKSPEFPVGTSLNVMITHVTSPQYFHCQGTRYAPAFGQLADKIHMHYSQLQPEEEILMLVSPGQPCIAQYSMDKSWYRAKVNRELTNNIVEVFFIDYGNIELVPKHLIKVTKPEFMEMPAQGIPCCLHGVTNVRSYWSPEHIAQFEDLVLEQFFTATFKSVSSSGIHAVELSKDEDVCINLIFGQLTNSLCLAGNDEDDDDDDQLQCDPSLRSVSVGRDRSNLKVTVASESRNSTSKRISPKGRSPVKNGRSQRNLLPNVNGSTSDSYANVGYQNYKLNVGDSLDICMIFLISPHEFWCQPVCMGNALKSLMKELNENQCDNAYGTFKTMPPSQTPCLAKFTDDGMWYRAEIVDVKQDQAAVFYVDYGNAEILPFSQLRMLPHRFIDVPTIAVKCSLNLPPGTIWSESQINALQDLALDHRVTAKVLSCLQKTYVLELFDPLSKKNLVSIVENTNTLKPLTIANGTSLPVVISWVNSPDAFWLQLVSNEHQLDELVQNMQDYYDKLKERYEGLVTVGTFVVAQFSEDSAWYRAVVEEIFASNVRVRFVDFGNDEVTPITNLKPLVPVFTRHCCQAVRCRLIDIKPISFGEWGQDAKLFLENIEENVLCTFKKQVQSIFHVELKLNGVSIAEKFLQLGLAAIVNVKPQQHQEPNGHRQSKNIIQTYKVIQPRFDKPAAVVVSYYTSIFDFWCQLVGFSEELEMLMDSLVADGNSSTLPHIKPGDLVVGNPCIAKNLGNKTWYRALVLDIQHNNVDVLFVDYGNTERVTFENIRQMTSKYMQLPRLASHCKLSDVYSHLSIVNGVFSELVLEKSVQAKFLNYDQTTEIYEVDLIVDHNTSIVVHLEQFISSSAAQTSTALHLPDTISRSNSKLSVISNDDKLPTGDIKEISVSYVYTPECFYVQFLDDDDVIESLADELNSEYSKQYWLEKSLTLVEVGMFCCAKYYLDDQWYRAVIVDYTTDDAAVRFVDYGNQERVSLQGIKPLAEKFQSIPFLAYKFSLANVMPIEEEWSRNACDIFEDLVFNKTLTIQNIGQGMCILIDDGNNIASLFIKSGCAKNLITESAMLTQPSSAVEPPKSYLDVIFEDENVFEAKDSMPDVLFVSKLFANTAVPSEKVQCRMTHITDSKKPGIFYIRLATMEEQYSELSKKLCCQPVNYCGPSLKINTLCSVFNPNSSNLCRGVIISAKPNLLLDIKCIDTGEYLKDVPASSVLNITADTNLTTLPPLALPCTLKSCQMWNDRLQSRFHLSTNAKSLFVSFESKSKPYLVELYSLDGQLLAETVSNQVSMQNIIQNPNTDKHILQPLDLLQFECLGVYVTHLVTPENFWCQPEESVVSLKQLEKEMNLYCSNCDKGSKAVDLQLSSLCVVRSAKDGKFYRGKVQSLKKFSCDILLVDFGNTETVERKSIWPLHKDFTKLPMQAFECHLAYVEGKNNSWSQNSFSIFQNLCLNQLMTAEICSILQHPGGTGYVINLTLKGKNVAELLVEREIAEVYDKVELSNDVIVDRSVMDVIAWLQKQQYRWNLVCGELLNIQICSVVSQKEFWIKMFPKVPIIDKLKDLMEKIYRSLAPTEAAVSEYQIGVLYAVVAPDENVYRAILKAVTKEDLTVFDIDCGLTKVVPRDCLKELFHFLADLPPLAIHCEIAEDPTSESFVSDLWTGQMKVKECKEDNLYVVSLIPAELSSSHNRYLEPTYNSGFTMEVKVCFTTNPQDFWCQSSDSYGLDSLMNQLQIYQDDDIIPTAEIYVGLPCLAKYSEDGALYRAEVVSVNVASSSVEVIFCDYGNIESVMITELIPIPECFMILPKQALHCSLADVSPKGDSYWDEDMCTGFEEIVSEKVFTMSVLAEMAKSVYMVNLKDGNDKLLQEILIECDMASGLTAQMFSECGESNSDLQSANHPVTDNKSQDTDSPGDDESQDLPSLDAEPSETESNAYMSPETEAVTSMSPETEAVTSMSPETEAVTSMSPETEAVTSIPPETEAVTSIPPETEAVTSIPPETEAVTSIPPETEAVTSMSPETEAVTSMSPETEAVTSMSPETEAVMPISPEGEAVTSVSSEGEAVTSVSSEVEAVMSVTQETESTLQRTAVKMTENEDSDLDVYQDTFDDFDIPNSSINPDRCNLENSSTDNSESLKSNDNPAFQDDTTITKQFPDDQNVVITASENCPADQNENDLNERISSKFTKENLPDVNMTDNSDFNSNVISSSQIQTTAFIDEGKTAESSTNHHAENDLPAEIETNRSLDVFDCNPSEWEELDQGLSTSLVSNCLIKPKDTVPCSDSKTENTLNPFEDCQTFNLKPSLGDMAGDPLLSFLDWNMEISNRIKVRLLNFIAPDDFYVTPSDDSDDYLQLSIAMKDCVDTLEPFSDMDDIIGLPCLAEIENSWQRGIIKSNDNNAINVFFVDIGKELCMEKSVLRKCPPSLYKPPAMSIHCFLVDVLPLNSSWSTTAFEIFKEFTDSEQLEMRIDVKSSTKYGVYLYKEADDDNLNDRMIDLGHAIAEPGSKLEANREIEQTLLDPHRTSHMDSDDNPQEHISISPCNHSVKDCITRDTVGLSDLSEKEENQTSNENVEEQFDEEKKSEHKDSRESSDEL
ncbi:Hypothetical predicted protein [Octopus vulgaris]|uniref:Tudor domain-containing protein n=1 Tax=Octopus vulgaris TaxID=6645 RepID=A0AA36B2F5_OCTVU|nr:Hypothetical predicted protein [Octopus vulgaris]